MAKKQPRHTVTSVKGRTKERSRPLVLHAGFGYNLDHPTKYFEPMDHPNCAFIDIEGSGAGQAFYTQEIGALKKWAQDIIDMCDRELGHMLFQEAVKDG